METDKLEIMICCIEPSEPFIYWINGKATMDTLKQIEGDLIEDIGPQILEANQSMCDLKLKATYTPEEVQYGTGYGDILTIPSYFAFEIIKRVPWKLDTMEVL